MGSSDDDSDPFEDDGISEASSSSSSSSVDEEEELWFDLDLQRVKENSTLTKKLAGYGYYERIQNMTDEEWQEIGRDISKNTHLKKLRLFEGALNDDKTLFLFRGLTGSSSIKDLRLHENGLSVAGIRSMVPFLQNANKLTMVDLHDDNIKSEGFNVLFRALRDSPIETLSCYRCGIKSIEIDRDDIPKHLKTLYFYGNNINADGCRELAKLLQGRNSTLTNLLLDNNMIDDEGVGILVDALQNNTSLKTLDLRYNGDISNQGQTMLLKLVNNISSIKATLQSNHTLGYLHVNVINSEGLLDEIQTQIDMATMINRSEDSPEAVGREKVIKYQLHSTTRAELCRLQEVDDSVYSEIDPLHLPEVLSLIDRKHGQGELYAAVSSSIMTLFSTVNREKCIQQKREYHAAIVAKHAAIVAELDAELATMKEAAGENQDEDDMDSQSNKRRRT